MMSLYRNMQNVYALKCKALTANNRQLLLPIIHKQNGREKT